MTTVDPATTQPSAAAKRTMTFAESVRDALDVALGADPRVVHLCARPEGAVGAVAEALSARHGHERVRSTPPRASVSTVLGAAVGAAAAGRLAVVELAGTPSLGGALRRLLQQASSSGDAAALPLVVRAATDVSQTSSMEAWAVELPGVSVVVPSTAADAKGLLLSSVFDPQPVLFVELVQLHESPTLAGPVPEGDVRVPLGKAAVRRKGKDVSVLTSGRGVWEALAVAEQLAGEDIDVEVVDLRTLVPLDEEAVFASVGKTKNAVVLHEGRSPGGFAAELSSRLHEELFADLEHPVARATDAASVAATLRSF